MRTIKYFLTIPYEVYRDRANRDRANQSAANQYKADCVAMRNKSDSQHLHRAS